MCSLDITDYAALFLNDIAMMDTRSPGEFARGSFPAASSLPLMSDQERAQVGTCYKQQGQQAAIALGHKLVSGEIKQQRVDAWLQFTARQPNGALYCWRGGLRSKTCQQWLREAGCEYPRVAGGYKAMRRFLIETLEKTCAEQKIIILAGHTGSAKTELLQQLPNNIDLEALAQHRGSAFGKRITPQPAQIDFENALAVQLLKCAHQNPHQPIVLEDESHLIGKCFLPPALQIAMAKAPLIVVESELAERTDHSFNKYILHNLYELQQRHGEGRGFELFAAELRASLHNIRRRLGGKRYDELLAVLERAIDAHAAGDCTLHREWVEILLRDYYAPMYEYQLDKKRDRVVFRGARKAVLDWVLAGVEL
ncbi:tRNA 2-selenouridine synthase [Alteromonadaceae bacterium Bs31]|nr:tRNA 2-selenouridine synthase [Alteromonadaceae bacterium Bs31]